MGCESSAHEFEEANVDKQELKENLPESTKKELESYKELHKRLENVVNDINSKFKDDFYNYLDGLLAEDIFFKRYESLLTQNKILKSDIESYGHEIEIIHKLNRDYKDYDVHKYVNEELKELYPKLPEKSVVEFTNLLESNLKIYPKIQKGFVFDVVDDQNYTVNTAKILKFNINFSLTEILILSFSVSLKNLSVLKEISDIISLNFNLITLTITISLDDNLKANDPLFVKFFDYLILIIENIKVHKFIKVLVLMFEIPERVKLSLPQKFYDSLLGLLKFKNLLGLMLVNIPLSDELGKKLCNSISYNNTLKVLMLKFNDKISNYLSDLSEAILNMKSISAFSLVGGDLEDANVNEFSSKISKLKIFNYSKNI